MPSQGSIVVLPKRFVLAIGPVATNSSYPDHRDKSSVRRSASARWSAFWSENDDGERRGQDKGGRETEEGWGRGEGRVELDYLGTICPDGSVLFTSSQNQEETRWRY